MIINLLLYVEFNLIILVFSVFIYFKLIIIIIIIVLFKKNNIFLLISTRKIFVN